MYGYQWGDFILTLGFKGLKGTKIAWHNPFKATVCLTILKLTDLSINLFKVLTDLICRLVVTQRIDYLFKHPCSCIFSSANIVTLDKIQTRYKHCTHFDILYCKILTISTGLIFVQKAFSLGLFLGELIFGGDYFWRKFCISKWVELDNKNGQNTKIAT